MAAASLTDPGACTSDRAASDCMTSDCATEGLWPPAGRGVWDGTTCPGTPGGDAWWQCDVAARPVGARAIGAGRVVTDERGVCWTVMELHAASAAQERAGCLAFVSAHSIRQLWTYPSWWRALPGTELRALGWAS